MVRWNLNAILSWVDFHIIDYPTAMNLNYNWSFGKKKKKNLSKKTIAPLVGNFGAPSEPQPPPGQAFGDFGSSKSPRTTCTFEKKSHIPRVWSADDDEDFLEEAAPTLVRELRPVSAGWLSNMCLRAHVWKICGAFPNRG